MMSSEDCSWIKGKVVKKHVENEEPFVDIEITCTAQRGLMHMSAMAILRLLSREQMRKSYPFNKII